VIGIPQSVRILIGTTLLMLTRIRAFLNSLPAA